MAKEKGYDTGWVERDVERQKRTDYLKHVRRTKEVGGLHRTQEGYEKAKLGKAAKILARLHQQTKRDEYADSIPDDAARGLFQSPTNTPPETPEFGSAPMLVRTLTPLALSGEPVQAAKRSKSKGKGKRKDKAGKTGKTIIDMTESGDESGGPAKNYPGGDGGGKRPPPTGGPYKPPGAPRKKKKKKKKKKTEAEQKTSEAGSDSGGSMDHFHDPVVAPADTSIPNIMGDDEKVQPALPPPFAPPPDVFIGFVSQFSEDELKDLLKKPKVLDHHLTTGLGSSKGIAQARAAIKDRLIDIENQRRGAVPKKVQTVAEYDNNVSHFTEQEAIDFIANPDQTIPHPHGPHVLAAVKRRLAALRPNKPVGMAGGKRMLPTTRKKPKAKRPRLGYTPQQRLAVRQHKTFMKKQGRAHRKAIRSQKKNPQMWQQRAHEGALLAAKLRKDKQRAYRKKKSGSRETIIQGGIKGAKLQIQQQGPGSYSVRSTGMSPQVKKHIQHLLNRLSGKLYFDDKLMKKKAAFTYLVKQLTDRKTVQVKIVQ